MCFMMASLIDLPGELLLGILHRVPIASFYCLTRTWRRLRSLSYDRALSFRFQPMPIPFQPADFPKALLSSPTLPGLCEVEVDLFRIPKEYGPPWNFDPTDVGEKLSWMHPNDLRNNIYTPYGDGMFDVAGHLLRDTLCSPCWRLRQTDEFRHQLQRLLRLVYCAYCQKFYPQIHFPRVPRGSSRPGGRISEWIGRTARFRVCAHKRLAWDGYIEACCSPGAFECDECATAFDPSTGAIRTHVPFVQHSSDADYSSKDAVLFKVRAGLEQSSLKRAFPHVGITDPVSMDYLSHTLRMNGIVDVGQYKWEPVEKPLLEYGGKPWGCRICKASFHVRYQRSRPGGTERATDLGLVIPRPIVHIRSPTDSHWLAQRAVTGDYRIPDAQGITWCADRTCGTSKGRRTEALLIRMLEAAIDMPRADHDYYFIHNLKLRTLVFLWVWSASNRCIVRGNYRDRG